MRSSVSFKNTADAYGLVAVTLHWIVAAAFIANYLLIYYREWFVVPRSEQARSLMTVHSAIGVSVLVFVVLRIVWRCLNRQPEPAPGTPAEIAAARAVHLLLYVAMVVLPLSGYLGTGRASQLFGFIEVPKFSDTWLFATVVEGWMGLGWKQFEAPMDLIHKQSGAWMVWLLIAVHAGAALYHHYVRKDAVLRRMWPVRTDVRSE